MDQFMGRIQIKVNERVYLRDPDGTKLGRKIIQQSIELINEIGFEKFTFKKLANAISSTEASVYRYFENKHKLLIYLVSWYWNWLEYQMVFSTANIESPEQRLKIAIDIISRPVQMDPNFIHVNEVALHEIVVAESSKAYLTKEVDADNKEGYFSSYKRLIKRISDIIQEINPDYKFPSSLVSTVIESAHDQKYFAEHIPSLTEADKDHEDRITDFLEEMVFKTISE